MAKRPAYLLIGLPHSGGSFLHPALEANAETLAAYDVWLPAGSQDEMFRAAVEIRQDHRSWGLRRQDVEGAWSRICRRAHRGSGAVVVGHDLLAAAGHQEIDLLLDGLSGFEVHVVATAGPADPRLTLFPDDLDVAGVLGRWAAHVRSPDRVHLLVVEPLAPQPTWEALSRVVGFDPAAAPLPVGEPAAPLDVSDLRLLATAATSLATPTELAAAVEEWAKGVAEAGYDVHGDLSGLAPRPPRSSDQVEASTQERLALVSEALSDALAEVVRLRRGTRHLEQRVERLEKKRRRLKQRLLGA